MNTFYLRRYRRLAKRKFRLKQTNAVVWLDVMIEGGWLPLFSYRYNEIDEAIKYLKSSRREYVCYLVKTNREKRVIKQRLKSIKEL